MRRIAHNFLRRRGRSNAVVMSDTRATMLAMAHDWFSELTGFREEGYDLTRSRLAVEGDELISTVNDKRYGIGNLEVPTLAELRARVEVPTRQRSTVRCVTGEARAMHADPELARALFQVASQFNLLEMTGRSVTPEDGVTRYSGTTAWPSIIPVRGCGTTCSP